MLFREHHHQGQFSVPAQRLINEINGLPDENSSEVEASLAAFSQYLDVWFPREKIKPGDRGCLDLLPYSEMHEDARQ
jgi:hypothetical protein